MTGDTSFRPIANPYIVGNPVEDQKMFFGREDDFSFIRAKVSGTDTGGMIVLCGTRRSGKTSILFQVLQGRLGDKFIPVLMDLQSVTVKNDSEFVTMLASLVIDAVKERIPEAAFSPASQDFGDISFAFRFLCQLIRDKLDGSSLMIMFDEYELFETNIDEGVLTTKLLDLLGDTIRGDSGIFLLFTGSEKLEERNAEYWSSSLGKSLHRRISFLSRTDALRLIQEPLQGVVQFEAGVPEHILALGAGQPFYTQVIGQILVDHLNEKEKYDIDREDVDEVVQEIIDNPLPHMIFSWGFLSDVEKVVIASLGELCREESKPFRSEDILDFLKTEKTGITLAEDQLNEALERLFQNDLLEKAEDGEQFTFKMELWRLWVGRMHSIWQALDEILGEGRKPEAGIIRIARRRMKRLGIGLAAIILVGLPFLMLAMRPQEPIFQPVAVPDSTVLNVVTNPLGAQVFVDNYMVGLAPLDSVRVEAGLSVLRFELEGFRDFSDSTEFLMDTLNIYTAELQELTGGLRIESNPPGARISLNDNTLDVVTPARVGSLSANRLHDVVMRMDGYLPGRFRNLQVFADSTVVVRHDFSKPSHPLTISTTPRGATVSLDGTQLGNSPQTLARVVQGSHQVVCRLDGYHDINRSIEVPAAGNRIDLTMEQLPPGHLILRVQPYADIFIDQTVVTGSTVFHSVALPQGKYDIEFKHPHFGSYQQEVSIISGDTTTVQHKFEGSDR